MAHGESQEGKPAPLLRRPGDRPGLDKKRPTLPDDRRADRTRPYRRARLETVPVGPLRADLEPNHLTEREAPTRPHPLDTGVLPLPPEQVVPPPTTTLRRISVCSIPRGTPWVDFDRGAGQGFAFLDVRRLHVSGGAANAAGLTGSARRLHRWDSPVTDPRPGEHRADAKDRISRRKRTGEATATGPGQGQHLRSEAPKLHRGLTPAPRQPQTTPSGAPPCASDASL